MDIEKLFPVKSDRLRRALIRRLGMNRKYSMTPHKPEGSATYRGDVDTSPGIKEFRRVLHSSKPDYRKLGPGSYYRETRSASGF